MPTHRPFADAISDYHMSTLLNDTQVREFALETVRTHRPALAHKKTRVSESFGETLETRLRMKIFAQIKEADEGSAKTLRPMADLPPRPSDLPWLVCQSELHAFIHRAMDGHLLTQVSGDYAAWCDHWLRQAITQHVMAMTSVGKTIA